MGHNGIEVGTDNVPGERAGKSCLAELTAIPTGVLVLQEIRIAPWAGQGNSWWAQAWEAV